MTDTERYANQRSYPSPDNTLVSPDAIKIDSNWHAYKDTLLHFRRFNFLKRRTASTLGGLSLTAFALFQQNIQHNQLILEHTHLTIADVNNSFTSNSDDQAILDIAGLGVLNAYDTAATLPSLGALGNVYALRQDNSGVDTEVIARSVIEKARADGITRLGFLGHSAGGNVSLDVARKILEGDSSLTIPYVILDSSPPDIASVRQESKDAGYMLARILQYYHDASNSDYGRFVVEQIARLDHYRDLSMPLGVDPSKFVETSWTVIKDKFLSPDAPSAPFIESQFKIVVASGAQDDIMALGNIQNKPKPVLVYLRPATAENDRVVDNTTAEQKYREYAKAAGLELIVVDIPNSGHANPKDFPEEYNDAITYKVWPLLRSLIEYNQEQFDRDKPVSTSDLAGGN